MSDLADPKYFKSHILVRLNIYTCVRELENSISAMNERMREAVRDTLSWNSEIDIEDINIVETFEITKREYFIDEE